MFIATLFIIAKKCGYPRCPVADGWVDKMQPIHTAECYASIQGNEVLIYAKTHVNFEHIALRERSQLQRTTCHTILFIWNVQNRQIHWDRTWLLSVGGGDLGRGLGRNVEWLLMDIGLVLVLQRCGEVDCVGRWTTLNVLKLTELHTDCSESQLSCHLLWPFLLKYSPSPRI